MFQLDSDRDLNRTLSEIEAEELKLNSLKEMNHTIAVSSVLICAANIHTS